MRPAGSRYLWSDGKWVETDLVPITVAADQGDFFSSHPVTTSCGSTIQGADVTTVLAIQEIDTRTTAGGKALTLQLWTAPIVNIMVFWCLDQAPSRDEKSLSRFPHAEQS